MRISEHKLDKLPFKLHFLTGVVRRSVRMMGVCRNAGKNDGDYGEQKYSAHHLFLLLETLINSFNKHCGSPRTGVRAITAVKVQSRTCGLDLLDGHALINEILNPVTNYRKHIPVRRNIRCV